LDFKIISRAVCVMFILIPYFSRITQQNPS
jgi:hypothetical protein